MFWALLIATILTIRKRLKRKKEKKKKRKKKTKKNKNDRMGTETQYPSFLENFSNQFKFTRIYNFHIRKFSRFNIFSLNLSPNLFHVISMTKPFISLNFINQNFSHSSYFSFIIFLWSFLQKFIHLLPTLMLNLSTYIVFQLFICKSSWTRWVYSHINHIKFSCFH